MTALPPPVPKSAQQPKPEETALRFVVPVGRTGLSITAGYLGLLSLLILPAPFAIVVSGFAISDIRKKRRAGGRPLGMGRSVFGLIAGVLGIVFFIGLWTYRPS